MLLEARALAESGGSTTRSGRPPARRPRSGSRRRSRSSPSSRGLPRLAEIELQARAGGREAIAALKARLKANPEDDVGAGQAHPAPHRPEAAGGEPPGPATSTRPSGSRPRSPRARQEGDADPGRRPSASTRPASSTWPCPGPRRPPRMLDAPSPTSTSATSCSRWPRASRDQARAQPYFERAVEEYDMVLKAPAELGRGGQQQGLDPPHLPRREPGGARAGPGAAQAGRPGDPARRVLRHPGRDPGGDGPGQRRRGVVPEGAPQVARPPGPQLPLWAS